MRAEGTEESGWSRPDRDEQAVTKLLFDAASVFSSRAECNRFLEYSCRGDEKMLRRVRELLGMRSEADEFFEFEPQVEVRPSGAGDEDDGLGVGIGRYRLIERLGAGGCGVVYLAEQLEPVRRKVALKIIRIGIDSPEAISRFEAESQALAAMNHSGIARVLDAGRSANGRPFFVMELVDGDPITDYCDARNLDIRTRLEIFVKVCRAIQHAHQRGVIHRDIKPSNVLIESHDSLAVPRVVDFGIATVRNLPNEERSEVLLGTPTYMSPEQVAGTFSVDTQSDIYSLGILLTELLSGCPRHVPEDLLVKGTAEARNILKEIRPELPSQSLRSLPPEERDRILSARSVAGDRLLHWCENDLDWIVGKAVAANPEDRYATVNALAEDVGRWLAGEPVTARPQTRGYRFSKLVQRNRIAFAAGTIALSGLIFGLGTSTWLYRRERNALEEQTRLRAVAEDANAAEAALRRKAQAGEKVAHAAVHIRDENPAAADRLLAAIALNDVPSSLESATTFRSAGEWLLNEGRWEDASRRFAAVAQAISRVDRREAGEVAIHFVAAASTVLDAGNRELYAQLRQMAVERFSTATLPNVADEVVKTCLIAPADAEMLTKLQPLTFVLESHLPWDRIDESSELMEAWQMLSLCLAAYRNGDDSLAEKWGQRCLAHPNRVESRSASVHAILAMALHNCGRNREAEAHLTAARTAVQAKFGRPFRTEWAPDGQWFDWIIARILLNEAENALKSQLTSDTGRQFSSATRSP